MTSNIRLTAIDLFAGAGGMSLGFKRAGFDVLAAFEADPVNVETYNHNFGKSRSHVADLTKVSAKKILEIAGLEIGAVDVVFGGPPCQGFSVGGKRDRQDPRNDLVLTFARLVVEIQPAYFVMENVGGLLHKWAAPLLDQFIQIVQQGGYEITTPIRVLDAKDYGVPQRRKRVIVLGARHDRRKPKYPDASANRTTVWEALADLPSMVDPKTQNFIDGEGVYSGPLDHPSAYAKALRHRQPGEGPKKRKPGLTGCLKVEHAPEIVRRFKSIAPGDRDPISRFFRLDANNVSPTLRAGTPPEYGKFTAPRPIHPNEPRCITVREGARLHSIPDWFEFNPSRWRGFLQLGNSVPPLLAEAVAKSIREAALI